MRVARLILLLLAITTTTIVASDKIEFQIGVGGGGSGFTQRYGQPWELGVNSTVAVMGSISEHFRAVIRAEYHFFPIKKPAILWKGGDWTGLLLGLELRWDQHRRSHAIQPFLIAGLGVARIDIRGLSFIGTVYDGWGEWGLSPDRGTVMTSAYFSGGGGVRLGQFDLTMRFISMTPEGGAYYLIPLTLAFNL